MTEKFLHYIWQHGYYNSNNLATVEGEAVQVIHPGLYNMNQGPDFLEARIRLGSTTFIGSLEIHIKSSDWHRHRHSTDGNYNNVVLHVVYEHDSETGLPEVELKGRIPRRMQEHYDAMMETALALPCSTSLSNVKELTWFSWKERLLVERLEKRSRSVKEMLDENRQHWEETFWWLIAKNFGGNINGDAFCSIARSIPLTLLGKHKEQILQLEALLFGQGGLLEEKPADKYNELLQREYKFLRKKYNLSPPHCQLHFLRMRPGNFPTVRLAQLAMLVKSSNHLIATMLQEEDVSVIMQMLHVTANDYWHYHYRFGEEGKFLPKKLGMDTVQNIIINSAAPMLFTYGRIKKDEAIIAKAIRWLQELPAEKNIITKEYESLGVANRSAFDSQALIELKKNYCNEKHCLRCAIGNSVLKASFGG